MNLNIIKISNKCYKLYKIINFQNEIIILNFENITSPFGLEKFQNNYYINWEIDIESKKILNKIEEEIIKIIKEIKSDFNFISNIKERYNFLPLLKTRIPQIKNKFIVDSNKSLFDIDYKLKLNITIEIDSIWFNEKNKTCGILWFTKSINNI